jgi:phospholipid N-methyltransferase
MVTTKTPSPLPTRTLKPREVELLRNVKITEKEGHTLAAFDSTERIPDWAVLKKLIMSLGGAWSRSHQAFVLSADDRDRFLLAQASGEIVDIKSLQFFPTPGPLAAELVDRADIQRGHRVLEPSAGRGNLVRAILEKTSRRTLRSMRSSETADFDVEIVAIEVSADLAGGIPPGQQAGQRVDVRMVDFLRCEPSDLPPPAAFDRVVMNPPFAGGQDVAHVEHALTFLRAGGKLVSIMSAGVVFRTDKRTSAFRERMLGFGGVFVDNDPGSFRESGTMVQTVTLVVNKPLLVEEPLLRTRRVGGSEAGARRGKAASL